MCPSFYQRTKLYTQLITYPGPFFKSPKNKRIGFRWFFEFFNFQIPKPDYYQEETNIHPTLVITCNLLFLLFIEGSHDLCQKSYFGRLKNGIPSF